MPHRLLLPRNMNVHKLAILFLCRLKNNPLELRYANRDIQVSILHAAQIAKVTQLTPGDTQRKVNPSAAWSKAYCAFSMFSAALEIR
ncbi:MAG: hypothetical protein Q9207_006155 [Kuettlingeria erythrocarpa]